MTKTQARTPVGAETWKKLWRFGRVRAKVVSDGSASYGRFFNGAFCPCPSLVLRLPADSLVKFRGP